MRHFLHLFLVWMGGICFASMAFGQFAPAAGQTGSTAIKADSSCFVGWAKHCQVIRGLRQITVPDSGFASVGKPENATGRALSLGVVSLGDGGQAILTFDPPIRNGEGFDFAVFENAFNDSFLELALVEVSSDSLHWSRFPAISLTQSQRQTPSFGATLPHQIHHLAGKYRSPYGTPFDLSELPIDTLIDIENIRYVKLIDVIGSIDSALGSRDSKGQIINDPYPTNFASSGFDLDAVGAIHQQLSANTNRWVGGNSIPSIGVNYHQSQIRMFFPKNTPNQGPIQLQLFSATGQLLGEFSSPIQEGKIQPISISLTPGMYFLSVNSHHFGHELPPVKRYFVKFQVPEN